jgi:phosphatidylglycerophosphate synthase
MNESSSGQSADCYSAGERRAMERSQRWRAVCLRPLLSLMVACRITPDGVTLLSLLCGLAFCPIFFYRHDLALLALLLHVLLDGLDGPLARYTGTASPRGSFTDSMADQTVVVASTVTLMLPPDPPLKIVAGGVYIFAYTLVVVFAMVRNAMAIPYSWVIRPRFVVYCWLVVECYLWPGSLSVVVWFCNALLGWKVVTGFRNIRRNISDNVAT